MDAIARVGDEIGIPDAARRQHRAAVKPRALLIFALAGDRLPPMRAENDRAAYALAKRTLAVVVAPPSKRRLQPIPPSADWRIDLAEGCPAHCQYCYLAGSLSGPPITRVYANLPDILAEMEGYVGRGTITRPRPSGPTRERRSKLRATPIRWR